VRDAIATTSATLRLLAGVNVKVVSERLGHASVAITLTIYAHVLPSIQGDASSAREALLRPTPTAGADVITSRRTAVRKSPSANR